MIEVPELVASRLIPDVNLLAGIGSLNLEQYAVIELNDAVRNVCRYLCAVNLGVVVMENGSFGINLGNLKVSVLGYRDLDLFVLLQRYHTGCAACVCSNLCVGAFCVNNGIGSLVRSRRSGSVKRFLGVDADGIILGRGLVIENLLADGKVLLSCLQLGVEGQNGVILIACGRVEETANGDLHNRFQCADIICGDGVDSAGRVKRTDLTCDRIVEALEGVAGVGLGFKCNNELVGRIPLEILRLNLNGTACFVIGFLCFGLIGVLYLNFYEAVSAAHRVGMQLVHYIQLRLDILDNARYVVVGHSKGNALARRGSRYSSAAYLGKGGFGVTVSVFVRDNLGHLQHQTLGEARDRQILTGLDGNLSVGGQCSRYAVYAVGQRIRKEVGAAVHLGYQNLKCKRCCGVGGIVDLLGQNQVVVLHRVGEARPQVQNVHTMD